LAGLADRRLLQHRNRLRLLPRGPQRLAELQGGVGVFGVGTIAFLVGLKIAPGIGERLVSAFSPSEPVMSVDVSWQPESASARIA